MSVKCGPPAYLQSYKHMQNQSVGGSVEVSGSDHVRVGRHAAHCSIRCRIMPFNSMATSMTFIQTGEKEWKKTTIFSYSSE